jgi:hypothetical protein
MAAMANTKWPPRFKMALKGFLVRNLPKHVEKCCKIPENTKNLKKIWLPLSNMATVVAILNFALNFVQVITFERMEQFSSNWTCTFLRSPSTKCVDFGPRQESNMATAAAILNFRFRTITFDCTGRLS